ncbi:MAG TPA: hypothetical protein PL041_12525, partial [Melioribacteraceae bacterium]|nr:hypothetical protein [Melioribacteraceae bacterium]
KKKYIIKNVKIKIYLSIFKSFIINNIQINKNIILIPIPPNTLIKKDLLLPDIDLSNSFMANEVLIKLSK